MTLSQMRILSGLITDALTKIAQGSESMDRLTEVYTARGGANAITDLLADHPEAASEIGEFQDLVSDVTPIVTMLKTGLMKSGSAERSVLMERRGDA